MSIIILMVIMFILFFLDIPIVFGILASALGYITFINPEIPIEIMPKRMVFSVNSFPLMAVPFFILAAELMNDSGITNRIFKFCQCLVGHIRGGLAHVNVVASIIMSGMSGSAVADASGLGKIEIEAMKEQNYDADFSAAITAASSTIGPIVPPSIPAVVYAVAANVSIGKLLISGIIPGLLMGIALMIVSYYISVKRNYPKEEKASFKQIFDSFKSALAPLFTPVILVGGIIFGIFTPTEAAAVASFYALILAFFLYKIDFKVLLKKVYNIFIKAGVSAALILAIQTGASVLISIILREQMPQLLTENVMQITNNPYVILFMLNIVFLILGCFMEALSLIIMITPLLIPLIVEIGIDPVHFGIILIINLMIGLITPPFGVGMYITSDIAGINTKEFSRAIVPFLIVLIIVLFMITYIEPLSMILPRMIFKV